MKPSRPRRRRPRLHADRTGRDRRDRRHSRGRGDAARRVGRAAQPRVGSAGRAAPDPLRNRRVQGGLRRQADRAARWAVGLSAGPRVARERHSRRTRSGGRIYFLRRLPRDPFHPDPGAAPEDSWGKRSPASPPDAPAEGADGFDVYSMSSDTGLNGVPYRKS
jgi:hypothetical protein